MVGRGEDFSSVTFKRGAGCPHCHNTGYRGRVGVFEMLELNKPMAEALRDNNINAFTQAANENPYFTPLSRVALTYAVQGLTTLEEVMGVTAQIEDLI